MLSFRSWFFAIASALAGTGSVHAQGSAPHEEVAVVTRMCLWNADKAMWSRLGLRKDQIRSMQAIRERYPAVVEGQWILGDTVQTPRAGTVGASDPTSTTGSLGANATPQGLQAEVRAVLTPAQVNKWMALCTGVAVR